MLGTLERRFAQHATRRPELPAVIDGERVLSFGALGAEARRLANHLASEAGVGRGDVVGLLLSNRAEFATAFLACQELGAVSSCLNFRVAAEAVAGAVSHERHRALIHDEAFHPAADAARSREPGCRCLSVDGGDGAPPLAEQIEVQPETRPPGPRPAPDEACNVIHTSGTTGTPKGAAFTHETQMLSAIQYCLEMGLDRSRVGMSLAPVVIGAATNFFAGFLLGVGAPQVMLGAYEPLSALRLIERHRVTEAFAVPTQIYQLADAARETPGLDLSSLRLIRTGGSAMPRELVAAAREALGCEILNTYGTTEACTAITTMHTGQDPPEKWGSIGKPTYFQEVRVVEVPGAEAGPEGEAGRPEAGAAEAGPEGVVEPPGRGQLLNRGPQCADTEFRSPERRLKDAHGWQRTRDVVELDEEGYLYPVDRLDNVIISGGENIYPQEVELFLATHPLVEDVAVLGVPDAEWGERVAALIVASGPELDAAELERFCLESGELPRHKRPRIVEIVDSLPRNILGKLDRHRLPELLAERTGTASREGERSPAGSEGPDR